MPRFFLHLRDGDELLKDEEGTVLPDLDAARAEALLDARYLLAEKLKAGKILNGQQIEIMDEGGALVATFPLRDAIRFAER